MNFLFIFLQMTSATQSIIFSKRYYKLAEARNWLIRHGYNDDVDIKKMTYRFRQESPRNFEYFATKKIRPGISFIIGFY